MRRYNRELGQTFVLVTHDPEVAHACDRVIRMRDGRVRDVSAVLSATPERDAGRHRECRHGGCGRRGLSLGTGTPRREPGRAR